MFTHARVIWIQIKANQFKHAWNSELSNESIQNRMFFVWFMIWLESFSRKPRDSWVELIYFLGKSVTWVMSWIDSKLCKVSWFDSNKIEPYPSLHMTMISCQVADTLSVIVHRESTCPATCICLTSNRF